MIRYEILQSLKQALSGDYGTGIYTKPVSKEHKTRDGKTLALWISSFDTQPEASLYVQTAYMNVQFVSASKTDSEAHAREVAQIESKVDTWWESRRKDDSPDNNYRLMGIFLDSIEEDSEENRDRLESTLVFRVRYHYKKGQSEIR